MHVVDQHTDISRVYGYSVIIGFGNGVYSQASFAVAQALVEPEYVSSAVGFITCGQISGVTIALAIANSIFLNNSQKSLEAILPTTPPAVIQAAIAGAGSNFVKGLSATVREEVLAAIVSAISKTYILVITAGALTVVLSLAMKRERLFMAAQGAA